MVQSLGQEDPLEEGMATHSGILPGESHEQRILVGFSPWSHEELDMTEQLRTFLVFKLYSVNDLFLVQNIM